MSGSRQRPLTLRGLQAMADNRWQREQKSREFHCENCGAYCTVGTDGTIEYGHRGGCPRRPTDLYSRAKPAGTPIKDIDE